MKEFLWKVVLFIANVHRGGTKESAGRFYGGGGLIVSYVTIPIYSFKHEDPDLLLWLLCTTAGLLLGKTAETVFRSQFGAKYGNKPPAVPSTTP